MRAEEARELALSSEQVNITDVLEKIKNRAKKGYFEMTFRLSKHEHRSILNLGYETETSDNHVYIIKW